MQLPWPARAEAREKGGRCPPFLICEPDIGIAATTHARFAPQLRQALGPHQRKSGLLSCESRGFTKSPDLAVSPHFRHNQAGLTPFFVSIGHILNDFVRYSNGSDQKVMGYGNV
jgi:hypothetical protein